MDEDQSVARMLLAAAREDAKAVDALINRTEIADSIVGFHAQQVVEKALKAVLATRRVVFRRTHDLAELLDLAEDSGIQAPPHAATLDELNPYAVAARYGLTGSIALNRDGLVTKLDEVLRWAASFQD